MKLEDLGYNAGLEQFRTTHQLDVFEIGRVVAEHKERYIVRTAEGDFEAEVTGNMRFTAKSREDFPAVGDWVALATYDSGFALIHHLLPRSSVIKRKAVGHFGEVQLIAANVDFAFLVQALDRDFNINRLERYLTICYASKVSPVVVLTKADLATEQQIAATLNSLAQRIHNIPVIVLSNETHTGFDALYRLIEKGKTYCMLGSSGVGKSSLLNNLSGRTVMRTDSISESTHKGRHVTSHRELIVLDNGGIFVDTPGMREVGIADTGAGLETTFDRIIALSESCRFKDCTHTSESGCSVLEALDKGDLDKNAYENYQKMAREKAHFETDLVARRKQDKTFGKMMKDYKKNWNKNLE